MFGYVLCSSNPPIRIERMLVSPVALHMVAETLPRPEHLTYVEKHLSYDDPGIQTT